MGIIRLPDSSLNQRWRLILHPVAEMMRRILVDYARKRKYAKRSDGDQRTLQDEALIVSEQRSVK